MAEEVFEVRLRALEHAMIAHSHSDAPVVIRMEEQVKQAIAMLARIDHEMITKAEFQPVKLVVYAMVGLVLSAVVGALIGLVVLT